MSEEKRAILAVSFGTSHADAREAAIGGVETALKRGLPEYEVRRCFTSGMVLRHIARSEGIQIDDPEQALRRAAEDGVGELVVQPTHVMDGIEYRKFMGILEAHRSEFHKVRVGKPLLSEEEDYHAVIAGLRSITAPFDDGHTAIIFIGHGTEDQADRVYARLQEVLTELGCENYYVGTIESSPSLPEMKALLDERGYSRVVLLPLMVVAGDHAKNDIAGPEDSWQETFRKAGYEVIPILRGLGEYEEIQRIYVSHAKKAE